MNIYAVVSDNARNMTCMGGMLQLYSELMFTTCNSHTGNLLAKDVTNLPKYSNILSKVTIVQKEFKKAGLESILKKRGGKKPVLYSLIRFTSVRDSVKSFIENLPFMRKVSANESEEDELDFEEVNEIITKLPEPRVTQLLFDHEFIDSVKNFLSLLDPIAKLINVCQQSDTSVADATEEWLSLLKNAPDELKTIVEERCSKSKVFNNVTIAANFLHPVFRGKKLHPLHREQLDNYNMEKLESDGLESF